MKTVTKLLHYGYVSYTRKWGVEVRVEERAILPTKGEAEEWVSNRVLEIKDIENIRSIRSRTYDIHKTSLTLG